MNDMWSIHGYMQCPPPHGLKAWCAKDGVTGQANKQTNKTCSIWPSRVVPHRSTTQTRSCLTALFGWEAVTQDDMAAFGGNRESEIYIYNTFDTKC